MSRYHVYAYQHSTDASEHIGCAFTTAGARAIIGCYRRSVGRVQCDVVAERMRANDRAGG